MGHRLSGRQARDKGKLKRAAYRGMPGRPDPFAKAGKLIKRLLVGCADQLHVYEQTSRQIRCASSVGTNHCAQARFIIIIMLHDFYVVFKLFYMILDGCIHGF